MKHKWLVLILLFTIIGMGGCRKEEAQSKEDAFATKLESASFFEQENFPEWLLIKIAEIESSYNNDSSIFKVRIFKGEWNKQIVYLIMDSLSSCIFCEVYYENEEKIAWNETNKDDFEDFYDKSKDWELIYEYGNAIGF
jgi:hypothetical protein